MSSPSIWWDQRRRARAREGGSAGGIRGRQGLGRGRQPALQSRESVERSDRRRHRSGTTSRRLAERVDRIARNRPASNLRSPGGGPAVSHGRWLAAGLVFGGASLGAAAQDDSAGRRSQFRCAQGTQFPRGGTARPPRAARAACSSSATTRSNSVVSCPGSNRANASRRGSTTGSRPWGR